MNTVITYNPVSVSTVAKYYNMNAATFIRLQQTNRDLFKKLMQEYYSKHV